MARLDRIGPLLAATLGVAGLAGPSASAQKAAQPHDGTSLQEIVITAAREADEALTAKVVQVLQEDPYVYAEHISVQTENGVVTLRGIAFDPSELRRALRLARRVAGGRRVVNQVDLMPLSADLD